MPQTLDQCWSTLVKTRNVFLVSRVANKAKLIAASLTTTSWSRRSLWSLWFVDLFSHLLGRKILYERHLCSLTLDLSRICLGPRGKLNQYSRRSPESRFEIGTEFFLNSQYPLLDSVACDCCRLGVKNDKIWGLTWTKAILYPKSSHLLHSSQGVSCWSSLLKLGPNSG